MNLAIIHYQLNRGGVTQVIFNHLLALDRQLTGERWSVAILYGGRHDAWLGDLETFEHLDVTTHVVPQLDFDEYHRAPIDAATLAEAVQSALQGRGFDPRETVIHAHNHSLGKNVAFPGALLDLAQRGYSLLLQIHDFAEDYRAANFRYLVAGAHAAGKVARVEGPRKQGAGDLPPDFDTSICYPQAPHIHYAAINGRDAAVLAAAGIEESQRHLIPNPVGDTREPAGRGGARKRLAALFDVSPSRRYVLYPVRCIRRKNIGEAVLWSLVTQDDSVFGFTLPPENPEMAPAYRDWKHLAQTLNLPCRFEVGREGGLRYLENIAAADLILTTSLVEGFGMVYLETWLSGHRLAGRDLPEITEDFVRVGIAYEDLQPKLPVPIDIVGASEFETVLRRGYEGVIQAFGVVPKSDHASLERRIARRLDEGVVDYGELDETLQQRVVQSLSDNPVRRSGFQAWNSWMAETMGRSDDASATSVRENADRVQRCFGLDVRGKQLAEVYRRVVSSERIESVRPLGLPGSILDYFLDARRYRPIAT